MMRRVLWHTTLIVYVFFVPIYYFHMREWRASQGIPWGNDEYVGCCVAAICWPLFLPLELVSEWLEFQEWKQHHRR